MAEDNNLKVFYLGSINISFSKEGVANFVQVNPVIHEPYDPNFVVNGAVLNRMQSAAANIFRQSLNESEMDSIKILDIHINNMVPLGVMTLAKFSENSEIRTPKEPNVSGDVVLNS